MEGTPRQLFCNGYFEATVILTCSPFFPLTPGGPIRPFGPTGTSWKTKIQTIKQTLNKSIQMLLNIVRFKVHYAFTEIHAVIVSISC